MHASRPIVIAAFVDVNTSWYKLAIDNPMSTVIIFREFNTIVVNSVVSNGTTCGQDSLNILQQLGGYNSKRNCSGHLGFGVGL